MRSVVNICSTKKYLRCDQIEEDDVGRAHSAYGERREMHTQFCLKTRRKETTGNNHSWL